MEAEEEYYLGTELDFKLNKNRSKSTIDVIYKKLKIKSLKIRTYS